MKTLRDTNNDRVFENDDETIWYTATITGQQWSCTEIIDAANRQKIKNLYFEQWLNKD
ncbi:hypothetical protein AB9P05_05030 [Roseivirga sp. BDSF3-8]|uniref:hypothetical protein n=1 Tax=Roseivirga sp. BDSF3-8 TaxID=3241598 RepID=UPI003531EACA